MDCVLGLIEEALAECKRYRVERSKLELGLSQSTSPRAWNETFYLTLREDILRACAKTTKTLENRLFRTQAYQILVMALIDIFQYGYSFAITKPYKKLLLQVFLTYCFWSSVSSVVSVTSILSKGLACTLGSLYNLSVFRITLVASPSSIISFLGTLGVEEMVASPTSTYSINVT